MHVYPSKSAVHYQAIQIDFMNIHYELHLEEKENSKKAKAKKKFEVRRAIEEHQERKKLQQSIGDAWELN